MVLMVGRRAGNPGADEMSNLLENRKIRTRFSQRCRVSLVPIDQTAWAK